MGSTATSTGTGAASGAATGAAIGSIFPGFGTAAGAIAGGAMGGLQGFSSGSKAKSQKKAYNDMIKRQEYARTMITALANEAKIQGKTDYERILSETDQNNQIAQNGITSRSQDRSKNLDALSKILSAQQNRQLAENIPALAEQANLKGIFRSTGMGNAVAKEAANLARDTSSSLEKQGISDEASRIAELYGAEGNVLTGRKGALDRQFSLEDYANQAKMGMWMGEAGSSTMPYVSSYNAADAAQGGITSALSIASLASKGNPAGAVQGAGAANSASRSAIPGASALKR